MPSYKNAEEAKEAMSGASMTEKQKQKKLKRGKRREERRKYGWNKKNRAANKADARAKAKALAQAAIVGGDHQAGGKDGTGGNTAYDFSDSGKTGGKDATVNEINLTDGTSMKSNQSGGGYTAKNSSAAAKQLMRNQKDGGSMYGKKHGASMNAYQDKKASMDDYSHEKKLKADGRYEAARGKMANAKNDFNHAHALKKDAHHDAKGRHAILKHMKRF